MVAIDPGKLTQHLRHLTETIGVRLAGMPGEAAAADYVLGEFESLGISAWREAFPINARDVQSQELQVYYDNAWHATGCSLFANTPGTQGEWVEAPLVFFDGSTGYQREDLSPLMAGNIVLHLGCHIESQENYRRLMAAKPMGLLMADDRFPGNAVLADAIFPNYAKNCGAVTSLNIAFLDAWKWRERGATKARFRVVGGPRLSQSANVVAELPGSDPAAGIVFIGAHHDTQADSVGADDNGSAVAGIMELARALAPLKHRRTIRLISFGAEEQLSVGSAVYVRRHREELIQRGGVIFNLDSYGSLLGWNTLSGSGSVELDTQLALCFKKEGQYFRREQGVMPYADHFPFNAAGIPGLTLMRLNCATGRFFHHRADDDMSRLDYTLMASSLNAVAAFVGDTAQADKLPFELAVRSEDKTDISRCWEDLFGGWSE